MRFTSRSTSIYGPLTLVVRLLSRTARLSNSGNERFSAKFRRAREFASAAHRLPRRVGAGKISKPRAPRKDTIRWQTTVSRSPFSQLSNLGVQCSVVTPIPPHLLLDPIISRL
jgi:hypothetical protein